MSLSGYLSTPSVESLPGYAPPSPVPSYSYEPSCGERRLDHTPQPRATRPPPTGSYIKKSGKTTIILSEQEEDIELPTYGRHAVVNGTLCLDASESISEVALKLEGKLDLTTSEGGSKSVKLIDDYYCLWSKREVQSICPSQIPFSVIIPETFTEGASSKPLPPSYHAAFAGVPTMFVKSTYRLHVMVTRTLHRKSSDTPDSIFVNFKYHPRTRSHRPLIPHSERFFSSVKSSPEEWYQSVTTMKCRPNSQLQPLFCNLFVPSSRIYGLDDIIPFHVQLTGKIASLREFFPTPSLDRIVSTDSRLTDRSLTPQKNPPGEQKIRVYFLRQVSVEIDITKSWKNKVIGEGYLYPLPPSMPSCYSMPNVTCEDHLDWEGEIKCDPDVEVGGFHTNNLHVKDFIMLTLTPPHASPLLETQINIPIRFVTESWTDTPVLDS
ncbi:hypothetical protein BDQ17DRAFT_1231603 [Cyathus striatus]|nr:hypothetical protein BDQ17DRAFT_1231603 [Cyathus striatus]